MKKNNKVEKEIILNKDLHLSSSSYYENWYLKVFLIIMCFFGVYGAIFSFITSFDLEVSNLTLSVFIILLITIFSLTFSTKKRRNAILLGINIIYIILYFLFNDIVIYGVINIFAEVNDKLSSVTGGILLDVYSLASENMNVSVQTSMSIALMFIAFIIIEVVSYSIIYRNNFILLLIATLPCLEFGVFFAIMPDMLPFLMLIICWIVALSFSMFKVSSKNKREFKYNKRKKKYFYVNGKVRKNINVKGGIILAIISFLIFSLVFIIYPKEKYLNSKKLINKKREIAQYINNAEYEKIFPLLSNTATGGISGGRLGLVDGIEYDNKTDLILETDNLYNDIYLKGYVGEVYTGRSWRNLSSSSYRKYKKLLKGICTQNLNYEGAKEYFSFEGESESSIKIQNVDANKNYIYAPYNANYEDNSDIFKFNNDSFVSPKLNKKNYSFNYYPEEMDEYENIQFNEEYLEKESKYREFVYDVYTKLPNSTLKKVREEYEDIGNRTDYSVYDKINLAEEIVNNETNYTLFPGKLPSGKDFVEYFLFENKKGYCSHYASAATVLLRMWGVPARYVEGYVVKNDGNLEDKIYVKDSSAHAWVEVYIDEIGWKVVDVTPGYDDDSYTSDNESTNNINNQEEVRNNEEQQENNNMQEETKNNEEEQIKEENSNNNLEGSSENKVAKRNNLLIVVFKYLLLLVLVISFLIIVIVVRHSYIINKRNKLFSTDDVNENVINMYKYLKNILEYLKKDNEVIKEEEFNEILRILDKAEFSNHKVSEEESEIVKTFVKNFANKTYSELSKKKKFIFKYIKTLY